jgi:hypothetical protein
MKRYAILAVLIIAMFFLQRLMSKEGYEKIEKFFKSKSGNKIRLLGIVLTTLGLLSFLFAQTEIEQGTFIMNFYMIYKYNLIFGWGVILCHLLICVVLFIHSLIDKFRWACLFALINIISFCLLFLCEVHLHFANVSNAATIAIIDFFIFIFLASIFGLESTKTEPQNKFFKMVRKYGVKIQADFDKKTKEIEK